MEESSDIPMRSRFPQKLILWQKPMLRVCLALLPVLLASIYLFGWRSLALTGTVLFFGLITEALFTYPQGKPVTSAVFVTGLIFSLSLPLRYHSGWPSWELVSV
jgi:Na+-transporting NADH:ubiquinone oxidoreductase subunit B